MNLSRSEPIVLTTGRSLLDVRGTDFDAVLLIEGRPLLYHWSDCHGSVCQDLIHLMAPDAAQAALAFRSSFESALIGDTALSSYLAPVLPALAPGEYLLGYYEAPQAYEIVEFDDHWDLTKDSKGYYPGCGCFVTTQSSDSLSEERVSFYEERIRTGERPTLLTISVEGGMCDILIDGHHKLAAYTRTNTPAHFLSIERKRSPRISLTEALAFIPSKHPLREVCEQTKSKYDWTKE